MIEKIVIKALISLGLAILTLLLVNAYGKGKYQAGFEQGQQQAKAHYEQQIHAAQAIRMVKANAASMQQELNRANIHQQQRKQNVLIEKIVQRPVYHSVCLDDDGVQQLNAAIGGTATEFASQPNATLP